MERNKNVDLCPGLFVGVYFYAAVSVRSRNGRTRGVDEGISNLQQQTEMT